VTSDRNFALRAEGAGTDEVGMLVQDFNRMLAEIERQDRQLREQQESLTEEVANRTAALVAANEQLMVSVHRIETHAEQIKQLTELGQLLQSCLSVDEVFRVICNQMPRLFPNDSGTLTLLRSSRNLMETMAVWGERPPQQRVFAPDECWAFRRGRPHYVADVTSPLRCQHFTSADGPVTFCVPMLAQGDNVGSIQFTFAKAEPSEQGDDYGTTVRSTRAQLAIALAEQAALALANLRLREALRSQSIIDPLTGLYNRRYLETMLERECRRAERARRTLSLMVIDIDHFKQVNDTWGHDGGDAVLREIGALLGSTFRGDDIACRFGGEEFVIVLPEAPLEAAFARAEDLRRLVHRLGVQHRSHSLGPVTVSIGLAGMPEHGKAPEELIGAADRALYEAKRAGRDRVVRASAGMAAPAALHPPIAFTPGAPAPAEN
ncbi:MAG: diguanylate cyclase, partial [Vicinamibacterales bacterium]